MPLRFEKTPAPRLESLDRARTVIFFPVGPLEDHGPHLPVGLDGMEAERLAWLAAEKLERDVAGWTGVVMPWAPLGVDSDTTNFAITVRGYVLRDWLVDAGYSLWRSGFRHFVCFSGHPGPRQLTAIEEAGKLLRRRAGGFWLTRLFKGWSNVPNLVSASSAMLEGGVVKASPFWPDPAEHGGRRDTAVALHLAPELVDASAAGLPPASPAPTRWERTRLRFSRRLMGYWGRPADATAAEGESLLRERVDGVFTKLRAVWDGANPEMLFRSWYSILYPNRTFFKGWLLAGAVMMLILAWVYVSFRMMTEF
jgi:creatinine amidohydrolase